MARYRAKANCIVGGAYRREGDIFVLSEFAKVPPHLALLPDEDAAVLEKIEAPGGPAKKKGRPAKDTEEAPGVTPAELAGAIRE